MNIIKWGKTVKKDVKKALRDFDSQAAAHKKLVKKSRQRLSAEAKAEVKKRAQLSEAKVKGKKAGKELWSDLRQLKKDAKKWRK